MCVVFAASSPGSKVGPPSGCTAMYCPLYCAPVPQEGAFTLDLGSSEWPTDFPRLAAHPRAVRFLFRWLPRLEGVPRYAWAGCRSLAWPGGVPALPPPPLGTPWQNSPPPPRPLPDICSPRPLRGCAGGTDPPNDPIYPSSECILYAHKGTLLPQVTQPPPCV